MSGAPRRLHKALRAGSSRASRERRTPLTALALVDATRGLEEERARRALDRRLHAHRLAREEAEAPLAEREELERRGVAEELAVLGVDGAARLEVDLAA